MAIAISATVLGIAMGRAWPGEERVAVADRPPRLQMESASAAARTREPYEHWSEQPEFLLLADDPNYAVEMPLPGEMEKEEAAALAATYLMQFFEADLRGEICRATYMPADPYTEGSFNTWGVHFGNYAEDTMMWSAVLRADDGVFILLEQYLLRSAENQPEDAKLTKDEVEAYKREYTHEARFLAEKFVSGDIRQVDGDPYGIEAEEMGYYLSSVMPVYVYYGDAGLMEFFFSPWEDGLTWISRNEPHETELPGTAAEENAAEEEAAAAGPTPEPAPADAGY